MLNYKATTVCATLWYAWNFILRGDPRLFVLIVALALVVWHNGVGALVSRLHLARGGYWGPWCGFREYWRQVAPVVKVAALFFGLWAFGAFALGL